jgi:Copper chaperone
MHRAGVDHAGARGLATGRRVAVGMIVGMAHGVDWTLPVARRSIGAGRRFARRQRLARSEEDHRFDKRRKEHHVRTEVINVNGMTCGSCSNAVTKALMATRGVKDVVVDLAGAKATVQLDPALATVDDLRKAVTEAGFEAAPQSRAAKPATGCCGSCG